MQKIDWQAKTEYLKRAAKTGLGSAIATNLFVVLTTLPFLLFPAKTPIRAMGWAELMGVCAIFGFVYPLPESWRQLRAGQKLAGLFGMMLAFTPFPLASGLLHFCAFAKGLVLEP